LLCGITCEVERFGYTIVEVCHGISAERIPRAEERFQFFENPASDCLNVSVSGEGYELIDYAAEFGIRQALVFDLTSEEEGADRQGSVIGDGDSGVCECNYSCGDVRLVLRGGAATTRSGHFSPCCSNREALYRAG
jgi:hypothetical protein